MATHKAHVNCEMLAWAREEAGYSLEEAAHHAKIKDTKQKNAGERLKVWEKGEEFPTQSQLAQIAKAYFRPIITFYMLRPPVPNTDVADFRTIADAGVAAPSPKLRALVSKMKARQQEILDLMHDDEDPPEELSFISRFCDNRDVYAIVDDIEATLQLPLARRERLNDNASLLRLIRNSAEEAGIYVLAQGDMGSHHSDIPATEFRGFALTDPIAPFIVLNDNDAKAAQTFTLIHELAHLWIGETGVSNYDPFNSGEGSDVEQFCNNVSAEFLLPQESVTRSWLAYQDFDLADAVQIIAKNYGVSRAAAAHRLWKMNAIEDGQWWGLYKGYKREWDAIKAAQKLSDNTPPLYYPTKKSQLGGKLIRTVLSAVEAGVMTYTRASRILDADPNSFSKLRS